MERRPQRIEPRAGARSALEASEERFRKLIEQNADGILVVGGDGVILYANAAVAALLNRPARELVGQSFGVPIIAGETTEIDLPWPQRTPRAAEMRVVDTEWEGRPALLASFRDVSEHKRLEEELRQKIVELALADRRKDEFLAMLAHELRNPLAPILNAVHVMRLRGDEPELRAAMRDIVEDQVRCLARLVDDLLDVSRITQGKIQLRREHVSLTALVRRSVDAARSLIQAKQHVLQLTLPREPVNIWADPLRLEQVLVNLLSNAAKYTDPGGSIQLHAGLVDRELMIQIRDNGIGIAPHMLESVFGLFAQVDHSLARTRGGLGIGLTLARNLVALHDGTLTAHSEGLGRGSEFTIRIPLGQEVQAQAAEPPPPSSHHGGRAKRVLVVDDNVAAAESLSLIVKLWGHECRMVHCGLEAVQAFGVFQPEVVLLDIGLPGMDGYAVAQALQAHRGARRPVLVALTGYGREEDRARALEAGFDRHFVKPLDLDVLERFLAHLDQNHQAGSKAMDSNRSVIPPLPAPIDPESDQGAYCREPRD